VHMNVSNSKLSAWSRETRDDERKTNGGVQPGTD